MLILTRKRNDSIRIGEHIVVRVMHTSKGSVKIGIEAPDSVRIVRGELQITGEQSNVHDDDQSDDEDSVLAIELDLEDCNESALMLQH